MKTSRVALLTLYDLLNKNKIEDLKNPCQEKGNN